MDESLFKRIHNFFGCKPVSSGLPFSGSLLPIPEYFAKFFKFQLPSCDVNRKRSLLFFLHTSLNSAQHLIVKNNSNVKQQFLFSQIISFSSLVRLITVQFYSSKSLHTIFCNLVPEHPAAVLRFKYMFE